MARVVAALVLAALACKDPAPSAAPPAPAPTATPAAARGPERVGPGWRLRGGVLEDVGAAFRWTVPAGWRVMDPTEALDVAGEVELAVVPVAWRRGDDEVYLAIDGQPVAAGDPARHLESLTFKNGEKWDAVGAPQPLTIGHQRFEIQRATFGDPPTSERLYTAAVEAGRFFELSFVYPAADGDRYRPQLARLVAGMEFLTDDQVAALDRELAAGRDPMIVVGADYAYHDGAFVDFAHGFTWRRPSRGQWRMSVIEEPDDADPSQRLIASDVTTGTTVFAGSEAWTGAATAYIEVMRERIGTTRVLSTDDQTFAVAGQPIAGASAAIVVDSIVPYRQELTVVVHDGRAYSLLVDALEATWPGDRYVDLVRDGLSLGAPPPAEWSGERWHDRRWGVAVAPPPGWYHDEADDADDGRELVRVWRRGSDALTVRAFANQPVRAAGRLTEIVRGLPPAARLRIAHGRTVVDRLPAVTLAGPGAAVLVVERGEVTYQIVAVGPDVTADAVAAWVSWPP